MEEALMPGSQKHFLREKKCVVVGVFGCLGCIWWIQKEILVFSFPSGLPLEEQPIRLLQWSLPQRLFYCFKVHADHYFLTPVVWLATKKHL
jgi:hypothetical protein